MKYSACLEFCFLILSLIIYRSIDFFFIIYFLKTSHSLVGLSQNGNTIKKSF
jgi:hypothetical protein